MVWWKRSVAEMSPEQTLQAKGPASAPEQAALVSSLVDPGRTWGKKTKNCITF